MKKTNTISRKEFIKESGALGALFLFPSGLLSLELPGGKTFYEDPDHYKRMILSHSLPILQVIQAGLAAPSLHNVQPWKFQILNQNEALLFVDSDRLLLETDPPGRQMIISQGCFLAMATIGVSFLNFRVASKLFPDGVSSDVLKGRAAVAKISVSKNLSLESHPLSDFIYTRKTIRTPYQKPENFEQSNRALLELSNSFYSKIDLYRTQDELSVLRDLINSAFRIETETYLKHDESRQWFRYNDREIFSKRDGISLRGNGLSGVRLWLAEKIFLTPGKESWHSKENKKAGMDMFDRSIASTPLFITLTTPGNSMKDQVQAGIDFVKLQLKGAELGLAMQPVSQILQEYPEMKKLRTQYEVFSKTQAPRKTQMILRAGEGESEFVSPRRPLDSMLQGRRK